jgi:hypothetical protein
MTAILDENTDVLGFVNDPRHTPAVLMDDATYEAYLAADDAAPAATTNDLPANVLTEWEDRIFGAETLADASEQIAAFAAEFKGGPHADEAEMLVEAWSQQLMDIYEDVP